VSFNTPTFAIPGLMAPRSPNAESITRIGDDGVIDMDIYCEPADSVALADIAVMLLSEENKILFVDHYGNFVLTRVEADRRIYRLTLPERTAPVGSSSLVIYLNKQPYKIFQVTREKNGFSSWKIRQAFHTLRLDESAEGTSN